MKRPLHKDHIDSNFNHNKKSLACFFIQRDGWYKDIYDYFKDGIIPKEYKSKEKKLKRIRLKKLKWIRIKKLKRIRLNEFMF